MEDILFYIDVYYELENIHIDDPFDPPILWDRKTFYELQMFRKYGRSILKLFVVHLEYPFYHVILAQANAFPKQLLRLFWYLRH